MLTSEQQPIPNLLKDKILLAFSAAYSWYYINILEPELEIQKYNNCGAEVIENFTAFITGERIISQENALIIHSLLLEDHMNILGSTDNGEIYINY